MAIFEYRAAELADVDAMAKVRASEWGTLPYWQSRIHGYMTGELHPHDALAPRTLILASNGDRLLGFVAGHLTKRFRCDGELEWINVIPEQRGTGVATELLRRLAAWFVQQRAARVCVDVDPKNVAARTFYMRHGAVTLNNHWLVWNDISQLVRPREPHEPGQAEAS
jgi:GNAT superfamily N-acetyltransferase